MKLSPFLARRQRAIGIIAAANAPLHTHTFEGVRIKGTTNGSQGASLNGRRARRGAQRGLRSLGHTAATVMRLDKLAARHPLVVHIVRVAPNRLDGDNLEASLKRVRDGLALAIGIDDRSPLVEYVADDERGAVREYALRFEVFPQLEPEQSDDALRLKINEGPYAGRPPITDAELARVKASASRQVESMRTQQVTIDEAIDRARLSKPTPNVKKPRVTP